jgi:hypothetical protein
MTLRRCRRPLVLAMSLALAAPGLAFAQSAKERELEARIAQLEAQVQALLQSQQQQQATLEQTQTKLDQVSVAQAVPAGSQPVQATSILPGANPGSRFSYGGFIKFDAMTTDTSDGTIADGSAGRLFYVPSTIPVVANGAEPDTDPYTDIHAAFSRFWFAVDHTTDNNDKFRGYIEADLFGGGSSNLGNEVSTNTHGITIRRAFVTWNNWLAGQEWTNFQDLGSLPETVDFLGVSDGTIFVRQAQLRYTSGPWSFSVENPHTLATNFGGTGRFSSGDNVLPDITARWSTRGDWGHFSVAGMVRQFKAGDETTTGASISLAGRFNLGASDDIRWMANYGQGLGRYFAFGQGTDVVLEADGSLEAINAWGGFVGWRHAFNSQLRSNLIFSAAYYDNDPMLTGWGVTERSHSFRANLIYSPFPKLDVGAEISYGERALEDDRKGDLKRIHTTVKYSF